MHASRPRPVVRIDGGQRGLSRDELATEEPLEIRARGRTISVTMRTPGHDDELAAGFLLAEGVVTRRENLLRVEPCASNEHDNVVNAVLGPEVAVDVDGLARHVLTSSSCGLCGAVSIEHVRRRVEPITAAITVPVATLLSLPDRLRVVQTAFARTGGLHAAAIFDNTGDLLVAREDVGRHNAVDKSIGRALLDGRLPLDRHVLLVSGRASFEIVQKAAAARIPIVAAVSAPSSLAVELAEACGQTLVGFLREGRMNVYAGGERVV